MRIAVRGWTLAVLSLGLVVFGKDAVASSPRLTSITLQRTGCMGSCPVYSLTLNENGDATYEGYQFVSRVGVYKTHVDFAAFLEMIAPFDPWSLQDVAQLASDSPSLTITMVAGNQTRVVRLRMYARMPQRFASIVAAMDGVTAYSRWEPITETPFAGTYVWSDGVKALDELGLFPKESRPDRKGTLHAVLIHGDSSSCNALLMPKTVPLGDFTLTQPGVAESKDGVTIRKTDDGVILQQAGKQRRFYAVSTGAEFMLRGALEQTIIHNSLRKC